MCQPQSSPTDARALSAPHQDVIAKPSHLTAAPIPHLHTIPSVLSPTVVTHGTRGDPWHTHAILSLAPQCAGLALVLFGSLSPVFLISTGCLHAEKGLFAVEAVPHC